MNIRTAHSNRSKRNQRVSKICLLFALVININGCFESRTKSDSDSPETRRPSNPGGNNPGIEDAGAAFSNEGSAGNADSGAGKDGGRDGGSMGSAQDEPQCVTHEDCRLVDTCCDCRALGRFDSDPVCTNTECESTMCSGVVMLNPEPVCDFGRCKPNFICDVVASRCTIAPPDCPDGKLPSVAESCFGPCVPSQQCAMVTSCSDCREDQVCVSVTTGRVIYLCIDVGECVNTPTCECLGDRACFGLLPCKESEQGLSCDCPWC